MKIIGRTRLATCLLILLIVIALSANALMKKDWSFEQSFLLWLHQFANPYLDQIMVKITQLGNPNFVVSITIITCIFLWFKQHRQEAIIFLLACLGAWLLNVGMKSFFARLRPQLWTQIIAQTSFSFPSGHALGSLVLYGFIGYLLSKYYPQLAKFIYGFTVTLIFLNSHFSLNLSSSVPNLVW